MAVPNCEQIIRDLAAQYPQEWRDAHNPSGGGPHTEAFVKRVAWVLYSTVDKRFGLNGKRGNPNDLSDDALNWIGEGPGHDPATGRPVTVIDFIARAGARHDDPDERNRPAVYWGVIDAPGPGAWVKPQPVGDAVPVPTPISSPWTSQHDDIVARLGSPNPAGDVGFVRKVAQQFRHTFGPAWGMKRADRSRDLSNNVIGYQTPAGLLGFKVVPVRVKPEALALPSPQVFEAVEPVNHLGLGSAPVEPTPPAGEPPTTPPAVDVAAIVRDAVAAGLGDVLARLVGLEAKVDAQRAEVLAAVRGQSYEIDASAGYLGRVKGTIRPKE